MKNAEPIYHLTTLIQLNYDRIACYDQAIRLLNQLNVDLNAAPFFSMVTQESARNIQELVKAVKALGGYYTQHTSIAGKACLLWMDFRSMLASKPVHAILGCCRAMDKMVTKGYDHVISSAAKISDDLRQCLLDHRIALESSETLRNTYEALHNNYVLSQNYES